MAIGFTNSATSSAVASGTTVNSKVFSEVPGKGSDLHLAKHTREEIDQALDNGTMAELINPAGASSRAEARANVKRLRLEAARRQDQHTADITVKHIALRDTHLPGLNQQDHDHAQCIHQLRQASIRAGR